MLAKEIITLIKKYLETNSTFDEQMFGESIFSRMVTVETRLELISVYSCDKYYLALVDHQRFEYSPRNNHWRRRVCMLFNENGEHIETTFHFSSYSCYKDNRGDNPEYLYTDILSAYIRKDYFEVKVYSKDKTKVCILGSVMAFEKSEYGKKWKNPKKI